MGGSGFGEIGWLKIFADFSIEGKGGSSIAVDSEIVIEDEGITDFVTKARSVAPERQAGGRVGEVVREEQFVSIDGGLLGSGSNEIAGHLEGIQHEGEAGRTHHVVISGVGKVVGGREVQDAPGKGVETEQGVPGGGGGIGPGVLGRPIEGDRRVGAAAAVDCSAIERKVVEPGKAGSSLGRVE